MDQSVFDLALQAASDGDYLRAADAFQACLDSASGPASTVPLAERPLVVRSIAFNLAQALNHLGEFAKALASAELGLGLSPSPKGAAIGLAAKGEALCGLGREREGRAAFAQAAEAHPVIGRINSADSMTRVGGPEMGQEAEQFVTALEQDYDDLDVDLLAEIATIRGKIAARRGDRATARLIFEYVIERYGPFADADDVCADAQRQLESLQE